MRGIFWGFIFLLGLALFLPGSQSWARPVVSDVRIGQHTDKTRFVLELSEDPAYRIFTLADPFRVVIDLPELEWSEREGWSAGKGMISALRYGLFTPGTSRVVLDVTQPTAVKAAFVLPPSNAQGYRLVVDLAAVDRATFQTQAGRTLESKAQLPSIRLTAPKPKGADLRPTIVIDAGHGGVDPGARGYSGVYEKRITLKYAKAVKAELERLGGYRVVLTRDEDRFIALRDRIRLAEQAEGDLFISLHANTHPTRKIRGASVYTLSETASDKEAEALAAKENKVDLIAGVDLSSQTQVVSQILIDLAQRETMNLSSVYAGQLVKGLQGQKVFTLGKPHRQAGFAVLKSASVPSVLFEIGYMTNPKEDKILLSARHKAKVAKIIAASVDRFFKVQQAQRAD